MTIESVVDVTITAQTTSVSQAGFGTPLVLAAGVPFAERVRAYASTADMLADGFGATHPAVRAAAAIMAQNPRPPLVKVGRRALAPTHTERLVPTVADGELYACTVNGARVEFTSGQSATAAQIVAGLASGIGALTGITANAGPVFVDVAAESAGSPFDLVVETPNLARTNTTVDPGIAGDLAAVELEDGDWYGLVIDSQSREEILAAAAWTESAGKLFACVVSDSDVPTASTTDVASALSDAGYKRTACVYHKHPMSFAGAAAFGRMLPTQPGSATWKFKQLAGVPVSKLTATEVSNLDKKKCNHITRVGGVNVLREGKAASGEFLDVVRGLDWLEARMQERVFGALVNADKVPFTDAGVSVITGEVRAQLKEALAAGVLADVPAPTVTAPRVVDVAQPDRAARRLPNVRFSAHLAGAVHNVKISGTVSA